mmetsp:Transcript_11971/g.36957  ORF Transcript_11971/g.36957 Transcript_11971/m.36957 type:complete len:350 (-) Transcript_11971:847-1896(-)
MRATRAWQKPALKRAARNTLGRAISAGIPARGCKRLKLEESISWASGCTTDVSFKHSSLGPPPRPSGPPRLALGPPPLPSGLLRHQGPLQLRRTAGPAPEDGHRRCQGRRQAQGSPKHGHARGTGPREAGAQGHAAGFGGHMLELSDDPRDLALVLPLLVRHGAGAVLRGVAHLDAVLLPQVGKALLEVTPLLLRELLAPVVRGPVHRGALACGCPSTASGRRGGPWRLARRGGSGALAGHPLAAGSGWGGLVRLACCGSGVLLPTACGAWGGLACSTPCAACGGGGVVRAARAGGRGVVALFAAGAACVQGGQQQWVCALATLSNEHDLACATVLVRGTFCRRGAASL